ncbi:unnamed protein product [Hydatigera taeniaeformis]|uniref:Potassium channel tetramerisation-type BTB domain-containing protein n=1 Tax=Hydatigena taeniaeformis TaxID=6205 RepID=A0A3P7GXD7_HYDTA|nr:unnamed protein product [Hydatigera taeniaeformis]
MRTRVPFSSVYGVIQFLALRSDYPSKSLSEFVRVKHFHLILNYLRDGSVPLPDNRQDLEELLIETRFYCLEGLRRICEEKLEKLVAETQEKPNAASIYIVKYPKVTKAIFASTKKVILLLFVSLISRFWECFEFGVCTVLGVCKTYKPVIYFLYFMDVTFSSVHLLDIVSI